MPTKPEFHIDLSKDAPSALQAMPILAGIDPSVGHHIAKNLRPPIGIYNTSISRMCEKTIKCCQRLETYVNTSNRIDELRKHADLRKEIIDYIELSLYAAAEHVDDLRLISKGFFETETLGKASNNLSTFDRKLKARKSLIAASTNAIKHTQARIRLFSIEFRHDHIDSCMHGYFIEGAHQGQIGPNKIFHSEKKQVFSITSLIWEIIIFALHASKSLAEFILNTTHVTPTTKKNEADPFKELVIAAARLPLYSFDETHPFSETKLVIDGNENNQKSLESNIYGSITKKWSKSNEGEFGKFAGEYEGDGISRTFKIVQPSTLNLQHWD